MCEWICCAMPFTLQREKVNNYISEQTASNVLLDIWVHTFVQVYMQMHLGFHEQVTDALPSCLWNMYWQPTSNSYWNDTVKATSVGRHIGQLGSWAVRWHIGRGGDSPTGEHMGCLVSSVLVDSCWQDLRKHIVPNKAYCRPKRQLWLGLVI